VSRDGDAGTDADGETDADTGTDGADRAADREGSGGSDASGSRASPPTPAGTADAEGGDEGSSIHALDDATVRQIAAGEVVERPASVVKELVENSLDADASRVEVAVEAGGTEGIRVRDDGVGMTRAELELAVQEHTTSKIDDIDDLEAGVGTLGFRGEALHTVGAVSKLTIRSKPRGATGAGTELRVEGGEVVDVSPVGCPEGTVVEVSGLFYNTPARRKFLKTDATEFDHVNTVVTQYALANPDVAVSLTHDDREVFATEGRGSLRSTVLSVYGREVAESMLSVDDDGATGESAADGDAAGANAGPLDSITGLVSDPETTRADRSYVSTFVNGRYVTSGTLREAVVAAYGDQLAPDRYPFAVLFLEVPPASIDVNVHPRKMEIRFDREGAVREAVEGAVRSTLLDSGVVRSSAPRGRSAPDEASVDPGVADGTDAAAGAGGDPTPPDPPTSGDDATAAGPSEDGPPPGGTAGAADAAGESAAGTGGGPDDRAVEADADGDEPTPRSAGDGTDRDDADAPEVAASAPDDAARDDDPDSTGAAGSDRASDPAADETAPDPASGPDPADVEAGAAPTADRRVDADPVGLDPDGTRAGAEGGTDTGVGGAESTSTGEEAAASVADSEGAGARTDSGATGAGPGRGSPRRLQGPTTQRTLDGDDATPDHEFDRLPAMRVLGQYRETYLVAETDEGLVLIDQHAADERVNYERLRADLAGDTPTQALAAPVEVELTAREAALFESHADALAQLGFYAGRTGDRTVEVRTVPAVFDDALDPELLRDALTAFVREGADPEATVDAVADSLLADLACYPSITGNTSLSEGSVTALLAALDDCENPFACPHGRPTIVAFDDDEIDDRFERDYPGHRGRRDE
jgi:DNA mismatch repair protein MutL